MTQNPPIDKEINKVLQHSDEETTEWYTYNLDEYQKLYANQKNQEIRVPTI